MTLSLLSDDDLLAVFNDLSSVSQESMRTVQLELRKRLCVAADCSAIDASMAIQQLQTRYFDDLVVRAREIAESNMHAERLQIIMRDSGCTREEAEQVLQTNPNGPMSGWVAAARDLVARRQVEPDAPDEDRLRSDRDLGPSM